MVDFLEEHWGHIVFLSILMALFLGIAIGVAFGCRTKRRRRIWPGPDSPPMNHLARRHPRP